MKAENLIILFNISLLLSCSPKENNGLELTQKDTKTSSNEYQIQESGFINKDTLEKDVIYDDEFIIRVIEKDFEFYNINRIYNPSEIQEKLFQNKHYLSKLDTLLFFTVKEDSIGFYKAWGNVFPQKLVIYSEIITIDKDIKIGVNKELFRKKFNHKVLSNIFVVKDLEGGNTFIFFFRENTLFRIFYESEYID